VHPKTETEIMVTVLNREAHVTKEDESAGARTQVPTHEPPTIRHALRQLSHPETRYSISLILPLKLPF
jgi:hypothetical protein